MSGDQTVNLRVNAIGNFSNLIGEVNKFKSQLKDIKLPKNIGSDLEKSLTNLEAKYGKFQSLASKGINTKGDFSKLRTAASEVEREIARIEKLMSSVGGKEIKMAALDSSEVKKAEAELEKTLNLTKQLSTFGTKKGVEFISDKEVAKMQKIASTSQGLKKRFDGVTDAFKSGNIEQVDAALQKLIAHAQKYRDIAEAQGRSTGKWDDTIKWATGVQQQFNGMVTGAQNARASMEQIVSGKIQQLQGIFNGASNGINNMNSSMRQFIASETEAASRAQQMNEQVGHLRTQANYFFGLQNMGRLVARGIREAAESVRDLDKAMTETAVVTEYSVGDMWGMLPEYTKLANKLGATTQGAYETMTLYFQQGLDKKATFEIGEETMKMARIAGLDYAETTNMMTAALRGFNMELNTTSAQRVNDVYSKLAAITASDTRELGLAMERTASIAHSANMDFGNTAAFLAQMIETTREAPENLGTAMKTIIARFQELKDNPYSIAEVEGEEVNFNRVDKALKSIGVDLMDNRDKFRDLDDVFMDIASKWEGLSQTQQRYVATTAAGSRQQSRFLAMVQNYERLKQLTDAAANSEGASQVQFDKTLESYEAKVNRLGNAWQAFTMSLANNKAIKGGVDLLQKIITYGNKIIQVFGKVGGVFGEWGKGIAEMGAAFGLGALGFKGLKGGANIGLGMLARMTGSKKAPMFPGGTNTSGIGSKDYGLAARITNPIVNAINAAAGRITGSQQKMSGFIKADIEKIRRRDFQETQRKLRFYDKDASPRIGDSKYRLPRREAITFNNRDVLSQISGYNSEQQRVLLKQVPGTLRALERSYAAGINKLNLSKNANEYVTKLRAAINQEMMRPGSDISPEAGMRLMGNPRELAKQIENDAIRKEFLDAANKNTRKLFREAHKKGLLGAEAREYVKSKESASVKLTSKEMRANMFSGIGSGATAAGQAIMSLGVALDSLGLHGAGGVLAGIGNSLTSIGMAASSSVAAVDALSTALKGVGISAGTIGLALGAVTALVAGLGLAYYQDQKHIKKIQKDGKKVLKDYEKDVEESAQNIAKLTDVKEQYSILSLGVDLNNNNVNLGTEEYSDYLKIINDIAKMHPELVKGYNAQGQAILNTNNAVKDAIQLEEDRRKKAEQDFTKTSSLDKLIASRNSTKRWQRGFNSQVFRGDEGGSKPIDSEIGKAGKKVIKNIKQLEDGEKILKNIATQYGLDIKDLTDLSDKGLQAIIDGGANIFSQIQSQYGDATDKTTKEAVSNIQKNIAKVGDISDGIDEVVEPIYKSLSTYASQQKIFDDIPEQFKLAGEAGLKEIAKLKVDDKGNEITGKAMQSMVNSLGNQLSDLGGHASEYQKIMDDVGKAQDRYAQDTNEISYLSSEEVARATAELNNWAKEAEERYEEHGKISDKILKETYENQLASIRNFTQEGAALLSEGFNTMADQIVAANGAFEDFQKQIEGGDYYTGVNSFKQIFDEIQDGIDNVGRGSLTWWKGAEKLLGENNEFIKAGKFTEAEEQIKKLEPMFKEGEDGVEAFLDHVQSLQPETVKSIGATVGELLEVTSEDFNLKFSDFGELSADQFSDLANTLGMSDNMLAAMLNKAKQFYNINFSNADVLRKGLIATDSFVSGVGKTGDNSDIYVRESMVETEASAQGYSPKEFKQLKADLENKGVKVVKDPKDITKDDMKTYQQEIKGMDTTKGFIDAFSKMGFSRDEISELYHNKDLGLEKSLTNEDGKSFEQQYSEVIDAQAEALAEPQQQSVSELQTIAGLVSAILGAMGAADTEGVLKSVYGEKGVIDSKADYFAHGKNANGREYTTYEEYSKDRKDLITQKGQIDTLKNTIETQLSTLEGNELKKAENDIENLNKAGELLQQRIDAGEKLWEQKQKEMQQDSEQTKSETENNQTKKQSWEDYLSSLENAESGKEKPEILTPEEAQKRFGLSDEQMAQYQTKYNQITQMHQQALSSMIEGTGLSKTQGSLLGLDSFSTEELGQLDGFQGKISQISGELSKLPADFQLTDEQVRNLGASLSGLSVEQINSMSAEELASSLQLTNEQIAILKAAGVIDLNVDATGVDEVEQSKKELEQPGKIPMSMEKAKDGDSSGEIKQEKKELEKPGKIPMSMEKAKGAGSFEEVKKEKKEIEKPVKIPMSMEKGKTGGKLPTDQKNSSSQTQNNTITLNTTISNPNEPKQKMDAAMPKAYTKTVKASIKMNATVSTGNLQSQMQKEANNASKGLKVKAAATSTVKTKADNTAQKQINSIKRSNPVTIKTKADNAAQRAIRAIQGKSVTINISPNFTGSWTKTLYVNEVKSATGGLIVPGGPIYRARGGLASNPMFKREGTDTIPAMLTPGEYVHNRDAVNYFGVNFMRRINHKDLFGALQSLGSAAKGRRGRLGPDGNGGPTLTGEEGFEIAWIPSESRSMILGANGPQLADLPKDTIIWDNKQSKKIIKNQHISMGSAAGGITGSGGGKRRRPSSTPPQPSRPSRKDKSDKSDGNKGKGKATTSKSGKEQVRNLEKAGKINSRIFNIEQRIAQVKYEQEKAQKALNKQLEKAQTTLSKTREDGNKNIKQLNKTISLNKELIGIYERELKDIANPSAKKSPRFNKVAVSWDQQVEKREKNSKGKWGKWKKTSEKKTATINLGKYVKQDKTGAYVVDYGAINRDFGNNAAKAKAVQEKIEKEVGDRNSKLLSAQSAKDEAEEKLAELGKQLYENFFSWKNELTEIEEITRKITENEQKASRLKSAVDLKEAALAAGYTNTFGNALSFFSSHMKALTNEIAQRSKAIVEQRKKIREARSAADEQQTYNELDKKLNRDKTARANKKRANAANKQVTNDQKAIAKRNKLVGKSTSAKTIATQNKKAKAEDNKIKKLQAAKNKQEQRIKEADAIINKKKSKKADVKKAKQDKKKAQQELKTINKNLNIAKKNKKVATQNAAAVKKGDNAKKNLSKHQKTANRANAKNKTTEKNILSDTDRLAYKAARDEADERLKIVQAAQKYIGSSFNPDGTINVTINEAAIESAKKAGNISKEMYDGIKEYYDNLVEQSDALSDLYDEQLSSLSNLYDTLKDLKEQYADRSEELLDSIEEAQKEEIDKLEKINSALTDALRDLLDEVKKRLDQRRKQEDNRKTEQDISEKQRRLAMLRANTAGGNQVEIAQLEKEIANAQQNYQRSLEDQRLQLLQDQADEAAKQRERQIHLLEAQLEVEKNNGTNLALVDKYLADPERYKEEIKRIWYANKKYDESTSARKEAINGEWNTFWDDISKKGIQSEIEIVEKAIKVAEKDLNGILTAVNKIANSLKTSIDKADLKKYTSKQLIGLGYNPNLVGQDMMINKNKSGTATKAVTNLSAKQLQGIVNKNKKDKAIQKDMAGVQGGAVTIGKNKIKDSHLGSTGTTIGANDTKGNLYTADWDEKNGKVIGKWTTYTINKLTTKLLDRYPIDGKEALIRAIQSSKVGSKLNSNFDKLVTKAGLIGKEYKLNNGVYGTVGSDGRIYYNDKKAGVRIWNAKEGKTSLVKYDETNFKKYAKAYKYVGREYAQVLKANGIKKFASGGLADQTGPAWLDGTPSKPELVLNAQDTKNFLALRDILSHATGLTNSAPASYGDTNVEVNINVDNIGNDYDVDRLVQRVKKDITKEMSYRNVTQVRNFR